MKGDNPRRRNELRFGYHIMDILSKWLREHNYVYNPVYDGTGGYLAFYKQVSIEYKDL